MPRKKRVAPAEIELDDETQYDVIVTDLIVVGPTVIRPGPATLKGKHIKGNRQSVDAIRPT